MNAAEAASASISMALFAIVTAATQNHCLVHLSFQQMLWPLTQSLTDCLSA